MDPRNQKPRDFVAAFRNLTEEVRKSRLMQIKWMQKYEPLLDEYEKVQQQLNELYKEKRIKIKDEVVIPDDDRTCLPIPLTTNSEYGWLAAKPQFRLEKYGSCVVQYPNPLKDITLLQGGIPNLGIGKGFFW